MHKIIKLILSLAIPQLIGLLGSIFTIQSVNNWYTTLAKPVFQPPSWLFGPVWTILFILIGLSLYFYWQEKSKVNKSIGYIIFAIQMFFNLLWSVLFFDLRNPLFALIEIFILWILILINILLFYNVSKKSAYLLIPYLFWVSFASILNLAIFILN